MASALAQMLLGALRRPREVVTRLAKHEALLEQVRRTLGEHGRHIEHLQTQVNLLRAEVSAMKAERHEP